VSDSKKDLKETSLIWENRNRITTLEADYRHITKTVNAIDTKVDQILENHLPHIQNSITKNNLRLGLMITIGATVGSGIIGVLIQSFL